MATFSYLLWIIHRTSFATLCKSKRHAIKPDVQEERKPMYDVGGENEGVEGGNDIISARPSTSFIDSTSNDTGRQNSSVYSVWADYDSSLRCPTSREVMQVNDNFPSTTEYEIPVTSTTPDNMHVSLANPKSYSEIVEEENDFSISISDLELQGSFPINHIHNGDEAGTILESNMQDGIVKMEQNEEISDAQSCNGSQLISTSTGKGNRRRRKSPVVESIIDNKVASSDESSAVSRRTSNDDEHQNHDEERGHVKPEPNEEPVPKKKKKGPEVIHDHITILGGDPVMYQCNFCNKKFKTKGHIKYHEYCEKGDKPFQCETCGKGFIAKSHYESHLRTHTGERPYICPKCGKGFNQRGAVTRHIRSHTGEKPFICQGCNRGFANAQALIRHTGERPFACPYCNKRFKGITNLKKHVLTHTGERPFSCKHCDKSFGLKWTLDLHLRTHTSERPYPCDHCSRAFSNSKDLRCHLIIHSGERPFQCQICQTAFRRKDNLERHIKNTHNQPKQVAKQLASEAAPDNLQNNCEGQNSGNI